MRVALKIAYDGRDFFGHQRQPDRRTVEGECLAALRAARILHDPREAFFRSASRTDRGVSAVGNVIAFNTSLGPEAAMGAFNSKARDVWAWAVAGVPETFHPRHARERWYRYILLQGLPEDRVRDAGRLFVGTHDFRSFCAEPLATPLTLRRVDVSRSDEGTLIDVRARSFRRGMVRRIVAGIVGVARGDVPSEDLRAALSGSGQVFGSAPPEPLVLMDVEYDFEFRAPLKPKAIQAWTRREEDARLRLRFFAELRQAVRLAAAARAVSVPRTLPSRSSRVQDSGTAPDGLEKG